MGSHYPYRRLRLRLGLKKQNSRPPLVTRVFNPCWRCSKSKPSTHRAETFWSSLSPINTNTQSAMCIALCVFAIASCLRAFVVTQLFELPGEAPVKRAVLSLALPRLTHGPACVRGILRKPNLPMIHRRQRRIPHEVRLRTALVVRHRLHRHARKTRRLDRVLIGDIGEAHIRTPHRHNLSQAIPALLLQQARNRLGLAAAGGPACLS